MPLPPNPTPRELKLAIEHLEELLEERDKTQQRAMVLQATEYERRLELANNAIARADARDQEFARKTDLRPLSDRLQVATDDLARMGWKILGAVVTAVLFPVLVGLVLYWSRK